MRRMLSLTLLGFVLFFGSIFFAYEYIQSVGVSKYSWVFPILCVVCLVFCAVILLKAGGSNDIYAGKKEDALQNDPSIVTTGLEKTLNKHNQIISQWKKTSQMRDQLKLLKIASEKTHTESSAD